MITRRYRDPKGRGTSIVDNRREAEEKGTFTRAVQGRSKTMRPPQLSPPYGALASLRIGGAEEVAEITFTSNAG